jgi:hypothetical protein
VANQHTETEPYSLVEIFVPSEKATDQKPETHSRTTQRVRRLVTIAFTMFFAAHNHRYLLLMAGVMMKA